MLERIWNACKSFWGLYLVIATLIVLNLLTKSTNVFAYDIFGYYLYLPKFFHDWNLHFENLNWVNKIVETYHNTPTLYQISLIDSKYNIIRYSSGMAVLFMPFFLVGHVLAFLFNYPMDGFSLPYQWSIFIESILVTCLGFIILQKILSRYFQNTIVQLTLICIFFGTNMTVHSGMYNLNVMSHNYLFMMYALLMYLADQYVRSNNIKYWYFAIFCSGLMALIRPVEIVSLCIPLFWGIRSLSSIGKYLAENFSKDRNKVLFSVLILLGIGSIQFIYWKVETGHFMVDSYNSPGEGLDLLYPHFIDYLFSFRKGWLLYTPLVGLCVFGFWHLNKLFPYLLYPILLVFLISLYLTASWSVWWYSSSYSSRAAIPFYSYLCFPFAALLTAISGSNKKNDFVKYFSGGLISLIIFLNLFQTWQYHKGIIHPDRMTKAAYFKNFLSFNKDPETEGLLIKSRSETGIEVFDSTTNYQRRILGLEDMEFGHDVSYVSDPVYEGNHAQRIAPSGYSKALWIPFNAITEGDYAFLKISAYVYIPAGGESTTQVNLCAEMQFKGKTYFWRALNIDKLKLPKNQWQYVEFIYLTPEVRTREDTFKTYFWNMGNQEIYIDKLILETYY